MTARIFRNIFALVIGLLIGAFSVSAFAGVVWSNKDSAILRNADGTISTIRTATIDDEYNAANRLLQSNKDYLDIVEKGEWQILDKDGRQLAKTPGQQKITIPKGPLVKGAAAAAMLLKGAVAGGVVGYLAQEGIQLIYDEWMRPANTPIPPGVWYWVGNYKTQNASEIPDGGCKVWTGSSNATGAWDGDTITCTWTFNGEIQKQKGFTPSKGLMCPGFTTYRDWWADCGKTTTPTPVTQPDLEQALEKRTETIDRALADYYRASSQADKESAIKQGTIEASGTSVSGAPQTTTKTNSDGSTQTTTTNTTYNIVNQGNTYNTNVVSVTSTQTTTTTNQAADGTTSTQIESKEEEVKDENYNFSDTDMPPVPDFYKPKYENGLKGVWEEKSQAIKSAPIFLLITALTNGAPSGGSCPSWTLNMSGLGLTAFPLEPPCIIWPFIRWMVIIMAFFSSRRIVFGG